MKEWGKHCKDAKSVIHKIRRNLKDWMRDDRDPCNQCFVSTNRRYAFEQCAPSTVPSTLASKKMQHAASTWGRFMAAWHLMASGSVEITTWFNEVLHTKISRHTKSSRQTRTDLSTQICKQDSLFIFIPWRCESLCAPFCTCVEVQWNCIVHKGIANQSE